MDRVEDDLFNKLMDFVDQLIMIISHLYNHRSKVREKKAPLALLLESQVFYGL